MSMSLLSVTSTSSSSPVLEWVWTFTTGVATFSALILMTAQTDWFSRKVLSSPQVRVKRWMEYQYQWTHWLEKSRLALLLYVAGGVNQSNPEQESSCSSEQTQRVIEPDQIQSFCTDLVQGHVQPYASLRVARIERQDQYVPLTTQPMSNSSSNGSSSAELYVWLVDSRQTMSSSSSPLPPGRRGTSATIWYQIPLIPFVQCLALAMDQVRIDTTTLCFIYDVSANVGSQFLLEWIQQHQQQQQQSGGGDKLTKNNIVGRIQPLWLTQLAILIKLQEQEQQPFSPETVQSILYALCRLEVLFANNNMNESSLEENDHKTTSQQPQEPNHKKCTVDTLIMTISAGLIPVLLPRLHGAFPNDRHVFIYATAVQTVQYYSSRTNGIGTIPGSTSISSSSSSSSLLRYGRPNGGRRGGLPASLQEALQASWWAGSPTDGSLPLTPLTKLNTSDSAMPVSSTTTNPHLMVTNFVNASASVPIRTASILESWMAAIDVYLTMKLQDKNKNQFLPYVCRWDYLLPSSSQSSSSSSLLAITANNKKDDDDNRSENNSNNNSNQSNEYWAMRSLLQYITGSRSREMPTETIGSALGLVQRIHEQFMSTCSNWVITGHGLPILGPLGIKRDINNNTWLRWTGSRARAIAGRDHLGTITTSNKRPATSMIHYRIKQIVFTHKLILIENKVLFDTVQPAQHWTLKAAVKRGCACCIPEDNEDDEQQQQPQDKSMDGIHEPTRNTNQPKASKFGYVDGKSTFAFDPTKFA